jgi:hypothetical protein
MPLERKFTILHLGAVALLAPAVVFGLKFSIQFLHAPGGTNTPIVVRGGSMTTRALNNWTQTSLRGAHPSAYCTNGQISKLYVDDPKNGTTSPIKLTANWDVKVYGRDPSGKNPSAHGIELKPSEKPCNGDASYPVALTALQTYSDFYPLNSNIDEDGTTHSVRFEDTFPDTCAGPNGNSNGDEDVCERPSQIIVTPDTTKPALPSIPCSNGECTIRFVK